MVDAAAFLRRLFGRSEPHPARRARVLCGALLSERGEASGATLAREALTAIEALDDAGRAEFFDALLGEHESPAAAVADAARAYLETPEADTLARLRDAVESPRQELFRRLNTAPGGTAALIRLREQLLEGTDAHPAWKALDRDLLHLFRSWFNRGFLRLERIDWRTPANVLEKLIAYEAVHAIRGWDDLRRRLQADRRCFAFFHPTLPEEPLIFIEVALTRGLAARIAPLIDPEAPVEDAAAATHAIFYSITNCQAGLRGVSFGNFLIKQVAEDLQASLGRVRSFATLSPVPGFAPWLRAQRAALGELLAPLDAPDWHAQGVPAGFSAQLAALCAHYLLHAKRGEAPRDAVARFHLGNGAALERVNWLADTSEAGLTRSHGLMVNYAYRLPDIERNHEEFVKAHRVIASRGVEKQARDCVLAKAADGAG